MSLWGIADIHASRLDPHTHLPQKPMDIFGSRWANHMQRLTDAWSGSVEEADTVIVAGDIDWGLHLAEAMETLSFLDALPGRKILLRGNHDYWWSSKTTNRVRRALPASVTALHNSADQAEGFNICGTKGSPVPGSLDWTPQHEKILKREVQRLQLSLGLRRHDGPTIVALHFPPFYGQGGDSPYREILEAADVSCVMYGHLHGRAGATGPRGSINGITYQLVAADSTAFHPVKIAQDGDLLAGSSAHVARSV